MKTVKKLLCVILALITGITLSACHRNEYIDYSEFNRRMKNENRLYKFEDSELFFRDGVYYSYMSLNGNEDTLLTMKEDSEHILQRVTVTASGAGNTPEYLSVFTDFCRCAILSFLPENQADCFLGLMDEYTEFLYTEYSHSETEEYFTLSVFSDKSGICIILERNGES